jgi:hypothetical protein
MTVPEPSLKDSDYGREFQAALKKELQAYLKKRNALLGRVVANWPTDISLERMQELTDNGALLRQVLRDAAFPAHGTLEGLEAVLTLELPLHSLRSSEKEALTKWTEGVMHNTLLDIISEVDNEIRALEGCELYRLAPEDVGLTEYVNLHEFYFRALSDGRLAKVPFGLLRFVTQRAHELGEAPELLHIGTEPIGGRLFGFDYATERTVSISYSNQRIEPDTPFVFARPVLMDDRSPRGRRTT